MGLDNLPLCLMLSLSMADNKIKIFGRHCFGYRQRQLPSRLYFTCSIGLVFEGPALAQPGAALEVTTSPNSSTLSSETLVGARVAIFEAFRTASRTLAILLPFLGVDAGIVVVFVNSGNTREISAASVAGHFSNSLILTFPVERW
jgi:hypothetical protein